MTLKVGVAGGWVLLKVGAVEGRVGLTEIDGEERW